jgi:hypothetical protein
MNRKFHTSFRQAVQTAFTDFMLDTSPHHPIKQSPYGFSGYFLALAFGASTSNSSSSAKLLVFIPE